MARGPAVWGGGYSTTLYNKAQVGLSVLHGNDDENSTSSTYLILNTDLTYDRVALKGEWVLNQRTVRSNERHNNEQQFPFNPVSAYSVEGSWSPFGKGLSFKGRHRYYDANFQSMGYSRTPAGLAEYDVGARIKALKGKLDVEAFYAHIDQDQSGSLWVNQRWGFLFSANPFPFWSFQLSYLPVASQQLAQGIGELGQVKTRLLLGSSHFQLSLGKWTLTETVLYQKYTGWFSGQDHPREQQSLTSTTAFMGKSFGTCTYQYSYVESESHWGFPANAHQAAYQTRLFRKVSVGAQGMYMHGGGQELLRTGITGQFQAKAWGLMLEGNYQPIENIHWESPFSSKWHWRLRITLRY